MGCDGRVLPDVRAGSSVRLVSGDGPAAGPVLEPEDGEAGEVDRAGSAKAVGEDAGLASASGFAPAPWPPGEVLL